MIDAERRTEAEANGRLGFDAGSSHVLPTARLQEVSS